MIKKLFLLCCFLPVFSMAQTKIIAHKSHSGKKGNFAKVYQDQIFGKSESNFGLPGASTIYLLDTVQFVNDSVSVISYRKTVNCHPFGVQYQDLQDSDFEAAKDSVYKVSFLTSKDSIASIKASGRIPWKHFFSNTLDQVVFIGFKEEQ